VGYQPLKGPFGCVQGNAGEAGDKCECVPGEPLCRAKRSSSGRRLSLLGDDAVDAVSDNGDNDVGQVSDDVVLPSDVESESTAETGGDGAANGGGSSTTSTSTVWTVAAAAAVVVAVAAFAVRRVQHNASHRRDAVLTSVATAGGARKRGAAASVSASASQPVGQRHSGTSGHSNRATASSRHSLPAGAARHGVRGESTAAATNGAATVSIAGGDVSGVVGLGGGGGGGGVAKGKGKGKKNRRKSRRATIAGVGGVAVEASGGSLDSQRRTDTASRERGREDGLAWERVVGSK
jgi:hypothetical protein